jgi:hypothetical protein
MPRTSTRDTSAEAVISPMASMANETVGHEILSRLGRVGHTIHGEHYEKRVSYGITVWERSQLGGIAGG